jgi:predicted 3-demethylubiquinone-9 3-methyltransferase (glyoxalase superfamily)
MPTITPFLWFDNNVEEAMNLYASLFPDTRIEHVSRQGDDGPVFLVIFELQGQRIMALNGGPMYKLTPAFSFSISCDDQAEVDYYWERLVEGGEGQVGGWLVDRFGLSWQVIPTAFGRLMGEGGPEQAGRVMQAACQMSKLVIADLEAAASQP